MKGIGKYFSANLWLSLALIAGGMGGVRADNLAEAPERIDAAWSVPVEAAEIAPGVVRVSGVSHIFVINGEEASLVVDTGQFPQAAQQKKLAQKHIAKPLKYIVFTHSHVDHISYAKPWLRDYPEATVVVAEEFSRYQWIQQRLKRFYADRSDVLYGNLIGSTDTVKADAFFGGVVPDTTVGLHESIALELGGRRVEVISAPGAEGNDGLVLWLPASRALIAGDLFGPLFPMWPNLYTIRGEPYRDPYRYLETLDRVLALRPAILVPSHFEYHSDPAFIRDGIARIREAVQYVLDRTIELMNEGVPLHEIERSVQLPATLKLSQGHGKVSWSVRAIWEQYAGWFRYQSTTELYPDRIDAVYPELLDVVGGGQSLIGPIEAKLEADEPIEALYLIEMAEADENVPLEVIDLKRRALTRLLERAVAQGNNFSEVSWLKAQLEQLPR